MNAFSPSNPNRPAFRSGLTHLAPTVAVIATATLLAYTLKAVYVVPPSDALVFPEEGSGPLLNGIYIVSVMGAGTTILWLLLKRSHFRALSSFLSLIFGLVSLAVGVLYIPPIIALAGMSASAATVYAGAIALAALGFYYSRRVGARGRSMFVVFLSGGLGAFLGFSASTLSAIAILALASAWDIFAVFRGPLGRIMALRGDGGVIEILTIRFGEVELGLGDLIFYSMLSAHVFVAFQLHSYLASVGGLILGVYLTFRMLRFRRVLPGLPLAVALGLALAFATDFAFSRIAA